MTFVDAIGAGSLHDVFPRTGESRHESRHVASPLRGCAGSVRNPAGRRQTVMTLWTSALVVALAEAEVGPQVRLLLAGRQPLCGCDPLQYQRVHRCGDALDLIAWLPHPLAGLRTLSLR